MCFGLCVGEEEYRDGLAASRHTHEIERYRKNLERGWIRFGNDRFN